MRRGRRRLHAEAIRHAVAFTATCLVIGTLVATIGIVADGGYDRADLLLLGMTMVFALYGPIFLWLTHLAFGHVRGDALRARLQRSRDERRLVRLLFLGGPKSWAGLVVVMGVASVLLLAGGSAPGDPWLVAACVACVVGTWVLLVAVFAAEYMRQWASDGGLRFPGDGELGFPDFVYVSVQLSTTFSASDVELVATSARRLATVHSIVAFAYSTVIVAVFASLLIAIAGR